MHPDYLGYVDVKKKVLQRAQWHDVKFLIRKLTGIETDKFYVESVDNGDWRGWSVIFRCDADLSDISRQVELVTIIGDRAIFIGISE